MPRNIMTEHGGKKWASFPATPDEQSVWDWLRSLEKRFLADAPYKLQTTASASQFGRREGQVHIFIQAPTTEATTTFEFKHILVVGELKTSYNPSRFNADFLQLARYVQSVFADQPTLQFVHAFLFCGSQIELFNFNRAGPYSSGPFDIHDQPYMFARALVGYATMDSHAMGLDTFIERVVQGGDQQRYVMLNDTSGNKKRVRLRKAMYKRNAIVCRGTTCFTTYDNEVVKLAWASGKRTSEVDHLTQAKKKDVKGVAEIVAHHRFTTIAEIRKGLQFSTAYRFLDGRDNPSSASTSTSISGNKRKAPSDAITNTLSGPNKKQRIDHSSILKKPSIQPPSSTSKTKPTLPTPGEHRWEDSIFSCLVISPAGRVISKFSTKKQLLGSMRDAHQGAPISSRHWQYSPPRHLSKQHYHHGPRNST